MFLQIHTLTSYHASLLNRDDAGLAKRIPFGNADRLRISSQCLKKHWRDALRQQVDLPGGIRSRQFFGREVLPRAINEGIPEDLARKLIALLIDKLIQGGASKDDELALKQPILFGKPEADYLVSVLVTCSKTQDPAEALGVVLSEQKKNFRAMLKNAGHGDLFAGIEGALFGRFVTSDILARSDASVHVAHAFTVHALDTEVDYFTVVDDLNIESETGAAHAGDMELGAGLFYGYVVVDIPLLVSNVTGCSRAEWLTADKADAVTLVQALVKSTATVSPGAKLGPTAPYAYSDLVLLETGDQQPRSLSNAFLSALPMKGNPDPMQSAVDALFDHLQALDDVYGPTAETRIAASTRITPDGVVQRLPLDGAVDQVLDALFQAK